MPQYIVKKLGLSQMLIAFAFVKHNVHNSDKFIAEIELNSVERNNTSPSYKFNVKYLVL